MIPADPKLNMTETEVRYYQSPVISEGKERFVAEELAVSVEAIPGSTGFDV